MTLLTGADFAVGACYAVVGAWLLRARGPSRHPELPVSDLLAGTADRLITSVGDDGRGGASLANSRGLRGLADRIEVVGDPVCR